MATNVKNHEDEQETEQKEYSDATLRRYYGEVTPYGTLPKNESFSDVPEAQSKEDDIAPLVAPVQQSTMGRPPSRPDNYLSGTVRSTGSHSYGTNTLRRSKGGYYTRSPEPEFSLQNIGYKDFLPKKKKDGFKASKRYHGFSSCIEEANKFLEQNHTIRMRSCESLYVRLDHDHRINPESTTSHDRSYVIGLRLWYVFEEGDDSVFVSSNATERKSEETTANSDENTTQQGAQMPRDVPKLCYTNVIPQCVNSSGNKMVPSKNRIRPTFESMDKTLKKFNESLSTRPITGQIISIETIPINYYHSFREERELDPDYGYWCLDYHGNWNFFITRIFYLEGNPTHNAFEIDFEDFAPGASEMTEKCPGIHSLAHRASQWLSNEENIKLLSSQTVELSFHPKKLDRRRKFDTRCSTCEMTKISAFMHTTRILRLWYLRFKSQQAPSSSSPSPSQQSGTSDHWASRKSLRPGIAVRNFLPCQITTRDCCGLRKPIFATTEDTIDRIKEWISMTNAEVICVQTDNIEKWKGRQCQVGDSIATRLYNKQDFSRSSAANVLEYRLTVLRVFIRADSQGLFAEPDTKELLRCPTPVEPCCCFVGCNIM